MSDDESCSLNELEDKGSDSEEMETKEAEGLSFKCEYCGIVFQKQTKYTRHVRTHTKEVGAFLPCTSLETISMHISRLWKMFQQKRPFNEAHRVA